MYTAPTLDCPRTLNNCHVINNRPLLTVWSCLCVWSCLVKATAQSAVPRMTDERADGRTEDRARWAGPGGRGGGPIRCRMLRCPAAHWSRGTRDALAPTRHSPGASLDTPRAATYTHTHTHTRSRWTTRHSHFLLMFTVVSGDMSVDYLFFYLRPVP